MAHCKNGFMPKNDEFWTFYVDRVQKGFFNHEPHEKTRKFFYRVVAQTDGMACGLKSSATVPVVIDACPPTFERFHVQEAGCRSVGSVGEKRRKLAMEFLNVTISTPPNSKSSCFFVPFVVKKLIGYPLCNMSFQFRGDFFPYGIKCTEVSRVFEGVFDKGGNTI
jgi:hypothetical protein